MRCFRRAVAEFKAWLGAVPPAADADLSERVAYHTFVISGGHCSGKSVLMAALVDWLERARDMESSTEAAVLGLDAAAVHCFEHEDHRFLQRRLDVALLSLGGQLLGGLRSESAHVGHGPYARALLQNCTAELTASQDPTALFESLIHDPLVQGSELGSALTPTPPVLLFLDALDETGSSAEEAQLLGWVGGGDRSERYSDLFGSRVRVVLSTTSPADRLRKLLGLERPNLKFTPHVSLTATNPRQREDLRCFALNLVRYTFW